MKRAGLIGVHEPGRARGEDADTIEFTAAADAFQEAGVVVGGGCEAGAPGEALARTSDVVALAFGAFRSSLVSGGAIACIDSGEAVAVLGLEEEARVLHAERACNARFDELVERHAGCFLDDTAENVGVVAVDELFPRLGDKGQSAEALHGDANRLVLVGGVPAVARRGPESFFAISGGDVWLIAVGDAGGVGQQVVNGDGAFGGGDISVGVGDGGLFEGGDEVPDWFVEADFALLHENEDSRAGDGFRLRGDAEDGVRLHATSGLFIGPANGSLVDRGAMAEHKGDSAGDTVFLDVTIEERVDTGKARGGDRERGLRGQEGWK